MDLKQNISLYLQYCIEQKQLSQKTIKAYKIDLTQFELYSHNQSISKNTFVNYTSYLHSTFKPKTVRRKLSSLKAFYNYLEFEEIINDNPLHKCKFTFKTPIILPKTISLDNVRAILSAAYGLLNNNSNSVYSHICSLRDIAVLELLFASGIRVSELCSLKKKDIDIVSGKISIYGKGSKERIIYICNQDVLSALHTYNSHNSNNSDYFFINRDGHRLSEQSVRIIINKYVSIAKLDIHITPHMFRHTFATLLLEEDVDIRYIQQMLGHSSITTTQIYTYVSAHKQKDIMLHKHPRNRLVLKE